MSEAKEPSQLSNEITDKTEHLSDFIPVSQAVLNGKPITRKMTLATLLAGILAPDGLENINIDNNNLINVKDIDAENITLSGSITANANGANLTTPYIRVLNNGDIASPILEYGDFDTYLTGNHIFAIGGGNHITVPYGKLFQFLRAAITGSFEVTASPSSTSSFTYRFKLYRYNISEGEVFVANFDVETISFSGSDPIGKTYNLTTVLDPFYGILNFFGGSIVPGDEVRIYPVIETLDSSINLSISTLIDFQGFR